MGTNMKEKSLKSSFMIKSWVKIKRLMLFQCITRIEKELHVSKSEIQTGFGEAKEEHISTTQSLVLRRS